MSSPVGTGTAPSSCGTVTGTLTVRTAPTRPTAVSVLPAPPPGPAPLPQPCVYNRLLSLAERRGPGDRFEGSSLSDPSGEGSWL